MPLRRSWKEILQKLLMFSLTSVAGTIVDLGLHWVLCNYSFRGNYWGSYWIAPTISFEVATITNFFIAYFLVWKERVSERSLRSVVRHFLAYNLTGVGAYLLKLVAMQGMHWLFYSLDWMQDSTMEPVLCNFLGLFFSGGFNFFMNEFVIFNKLKKDA